MSRINTTLKALRDMFGNSYSLSSICMLTGCTGSNFKKRKDQLIETCLANGIDFVIWDQADQLKRLDQLTQYRDLLGKIAEVQPLNLLELLEDTLTETTSDQRFLDLALKYTG